MCQDEKGILSCHRYALSRDLIEMLCIRLRDVTLILLCILIVLHLVAVIIIKMAMRH